MRVSATLPKLISYSLAVFPILSWTEGAEKAEMVDVVMEAEKLVAESAERVVARVLGETSGWRYEVFAMTSPGIELNHAASPSHPVALAIRKNAGSLGRAKTVEDKNKIEDFRSSQYRCYLEQVEALKDGGDLYFFERFRPQQPAETQTGVMVVRAGKVIKIWFMRENWQELPQ